MTLVFECKFYHLLNVKSEMIIAMIMMPWSVPWYVLQGKEQELDLSFSQLYSPSTQLSAR